MGDRCLRWRMATTADHLPEDTAGLKAALVETRARLAGAEALIEQLQMVIAKMKRATFGARSERSQRLLDQMELQLEELAATVAEDDAKTAPAPVAVPGLTRRPATRRNFPAHLQRRRIVHPAPTACTCCGGTNLSKIGEDVTETLDVVPRQWFVTEHVRDKFSCRACEKITQPPAPFHVIARGFAGPSLLAMMLVDKYANHQPAQSAERTVCARGGSNCRFDARRPCRRLRSDGDVGRTHGASCSSLPTSLRRHASRSKGRSRRSRSRRFRSSMPSSRWSSLNGMLPEPRLAARRKEIRAAGQWPHRVDERRAKQALAPQRGRQGDGLPAQAHRRLHPLPR